MTLRALSMYLRALRLGPVRADVREHTALRNRGLGGNVRVGRTRLRQSADGKADEGEKEGEAHVRPTVRGGCLYNSENAKAERLTRTSQRTLQDQPATASVFILSNEPCADDGWHRTRAGYDE